MVSRNQRRASELLKEGDAACATQDLASAEKAFAKSLELVPNNAGGLTGMARMAWERRHDDEGARAYYDAAVAACPESLEARLNRGSFLATVGDETAVSDANYVLSKQSNNINAYKLLHRVGKIRHGDLNFQELLRLSQSGSLSDDDRARVHFIIASIYEKNNKFKDAFTHYRIANDFKSKDIDFRAAKFYSTFVNRAIKYALPLPQIPVIEDAPRMIFIVGMPRSGSTLLEQLLTTREGVGSVGEASFFRRHWRATINACFGDTISSSSDPSKLAAYLTRERLLALRDSYMRDVKATVPAKNHAVIVDKQLDNYDVLPIISTLFPNSRILHTYRHPLDTCVSCYGQDFSSVRYAARLSTIGYTYRFYHEVVKDWKDLEIPQLLDVNYEALVQNPTTQVKKVMDFCDLWFDDTALDPRASENVVRTASYAQVKRAIYQSSIGRWRHYAAELEPLVYALGGWEWVNAHTPADHGAH